MKYNEDIFVDGTFYILYLNLITKCSLQELIKYLNSFHTTSFLILKNKEQICYEILFEKNKEKC